MGISKLILDAGPIVIDASVVSRPRFGCDSPWSTETYWNLLAASLTTTNTENLPDSDSLIRK
jgi:hypothetical protein